MKTLYTSVKDCLRLVSRSNLKFLEVSFDAVTCLDLAFDLSLVNILPCILSTKNIVDFLPLQMHLVLKCLVYFEDVGARPTVESKITTCHLRQQQVTTSRTEKHDLSVYSRQSLLVYQKLYIFILISFLSLFLP